MHALQGGSEGDPEACARNGDAAGSDRQPSVEPEEALPAERRGKAPGMKGEPGRDGEAVAEGTEGGPEEEGGARGPGEARRERRQHGPRAALGEERLREHLSGGGEGQAEAHACERGGGAAGIRRPEGSALEQDGGDGLGEDDQRAGGRTGDEEPGLDRPVLGGRDAVAVPFRENGPPIPAGARSR